MTEMQLTWEVRSKVSRLEVVIVSYDESAFLIREALNARAPAFVFKTDLANDLFPAVEAAAKHDTFVSHTESSSSGEYYVRSGNGGFSNLALRGQVSSPSEVFHRLGRTFTG
jgi:DNA-binding NarL/FixJ family response regulator